MSRVAVLGAGGGGLSATVELVRAGHDVVLWNRKPATLAPHMERGGVRYTGIVGDGQVEPALMTTDLAEALDGAEAAVVCLPSVAHARMFADLASIGYSGPVVLNPGHTGAALHARRVWLCAGVPLPPLAEFSTLTYVARVGADGTVNTTGRAGRVRVASLPGGEAAVEWGIKLFPGAEPIADVLGSSLANANLVLHPPGAILGLSWVEATGGDFTFYVEGMTDGVAKVLEELDDERRRVAAAFGHRLPPLVDEMSAIGTVDPRPGGWPDARTAISSGTANAAIRAPESTAHRYYREDLPYALLPFVTLADIAGVPVRSGRALLDLARVVLGTDVVDDGLGRVRMGLVGADADRLLQLVRN